jgi:hypothetical protein
MKSGKFYPENYFIRHNAIDLQKGNTIRKRIIRSDETARRLGRKYEDI